MPCESNDTGEIPLYNRAMNKTLVTVGTLSLAVGLALGNTAQAATPTAKPTISSTKKPTVTPTKAAKEGTATHEMSEASTGTGEEGSKKVTKAITNPATFWLRGFCCSSRLLRA